MATANQGNGFLTGLKKLLFQDEQGTVVHPQQDGNATAPPPDMPLTGYPATPQFSPPVPTPSAGGADAEQMQAKANQLLESINQPGVDFLEVWNAVVENGGANPATVKSAFSTLRYADKTLTKEKLLSTGRFYKGKLQEAIDADVQRKGARLKQLEEEKEAKRGSLAQELKNLEQQIATLQQSLQEKQQQQARLDDDFNQPIADIRQTIITGQNTVSAMVAQMDEMLVLMDREL